MTTGVHMTIRWCFECEDEQVFERPECEDGHGENCLDLFCGACGTGIVLGLVDVTEPVRVGSQAA